MFFGRKLIFISLLIFAGFSSLIAMQDGDRSPTSNRLVAYDSLFNQGNIHNAVDAINGLFPGMLISKPGANPNDLPDVLVRGIGTELNNRFPLIVIDGLISMSIESIDLNDIASIRLLKGAETTRYGVQGGSGVLEITTKNTGLGEPQIQVNAFTAVETIDQKMKPLNRQQFLDEGGIDLGADTDWFDVITSTALSHVVNLTTSGGSDKFNYRISSNNRLVDGILENTGFDRFNGFAKLNYQLSPNIQLGYTGSVTREERNFGFNNAFKHAFLQNPTQPIYFENGNLYQGIVFDYFNPAGFIDLLSSTGENWLNAHSLNGEIDLGNSSLDINLGLSHVNTSSLEAFSPDFFFATNYFRGTVNRTAVARNVQSVNGRIAWTKNNKQWKKWNYNTTLGLNYQTWENESWTRQLRFGEDTTTTSINDLKFTSPDFTFNGAYDEWIQTSVYLRYENANALGDNAEGNLLSSFSISAPLDSIFGALKGFRLSASMGLSGTVRNSQEQPSSIEFPNVTRRNEDLTFEKNKNREATISYQHQDLPINISATRFMRRVEGMMGYDYDRDENDRIIRESERFDNVGDLDNTGWEIAFDYATYFSDIKWQSRFNLSSLTTKWVATPNDGVQSGFIPFNGTGPSRIKIGEAYDVFYSQVLNTVQNGQFVFEDLNGDGQVDPFNDITAVGQPLPQFWLNWQNELTWGRTKLSFMVESMLGHSTVNSIRMRHGVESSFYNRTQPDIRVGQFDNLYADLFVEESSYVRLRYISIERNFTLGNIDIKGFLVGNNLFTFSNYTGNDPSPALFSDSGSTRNTGVDSRFRWLPSRSVTIGLSATF